MVELRPSEKGSGDPAFADVVGQQALKTGLLAVAADSDLDGFLIRGEKGTAKSTTVRALADLLPAQRVVADCPYGCPPPGTDSIATGAHEAGRCPDCRGRSNPPVEERPVPLVTLPLGATRERVVGTLSVSDALAGEHEFDPGLLARANRGLLYVDEVNLLEDHLVDVLLDAAASGVNRVERDGVSVTHPAEFTLIGTMNPEEGDLRPQLRDRFAISTTVTACEDLEDRVAIVERALGGGDSQGGATEDGQRGRDPGARLTAARDRLARDGVELPEETLRRIARVCRDAGVDGHRGDVAVARTARALAALDDRRQVRAADLERAVEFGLGHRLKSRPFADDADVEDVLEEHFEEPSDGQGDAADGGGDGEGRGEEGRDGGGEADAGDAGEGEGRDAGAGSDSAGDASEGESDPGGTGRSDEPTDQPNGSAPEETEGSGSGAESEASGSTEAQGDDGESGTGTGERPPGGAAARGPPQGEDDAESAAGPRGGQREDGDDAAPATPLVPGEERAGVGSADAPDVSVDDPAPERDGHRGSRAQSTASVATDGPRVRSRQARDGDPVDANASVRAAARRGADGVDSRDLRASVRRRDSAALVTFVVDASASMRPAMRAAKGTVLELLRDAYEHRDEVAVVAVAGEDAEVLLPPTDSVTLAARHLKELPTGDRTPLPDGLRTAAEVLDRADAAANVVVVVTDGRANVAEGSPTRSTRAAGRALAARDPTVVVVDADADATGVLDVLVAATNGECVPLAALTAERVDAALGAAIDDGTD